MTRNNGGLSLSSKECGVIFEQVDIVVPKDDELSCGFTGEL
jgi:hypothetical protein